MSILLILALVKTSLGVVKLLYAGKTLAMVMQDVQKVSTSIKNFIPGPFHTQRYKQFFVSIVEYWK